jgi:hypothetical protein
LLPGGTSLSARDSEGSEEDEEPAEDTAGPQTQTHPEQAEDTANTLIGICGISAEMLNAEMLNTLSYDADKNTVYKRGTPLSKVSGIKKTNKASRISLVKIINGSKPGGPKSAYAKMMLPKPIFDLAPTQLAQRACMIAGFYTHPDELKKTIAQATDEINAIFANSRIAE